MACSMKDIAQKAGVSLSAVSLVVNGKAEGRLCAEKRERILRLIQKEGLTTNVSARELRTGKRQLVGVLYPFPANSHQGEVLASLQQCLAESGHLALFSFWKDYDQVPDAYDAVLSRSVAGIIAWENPYIARFSGIPTVTYYGGPAPAADDVTSDEDSCAEQILRLFREQGHTRIGFVNGPRDMISKALLRRIRKEGLPFRDEWFCADRQQPFACFAALSERPSAFFGSDFRIMRLLAQARRAGFHAPGDFSVIGFDNQQEAALLDPPLTTFCIPPRKLAQTLVSLLLQRIDCPNAPIQRIQLPVSCILRESCGPYNAESRWNRDEIVLGAERLRVETRLCRLKI